MKRSASINVERMVKWVPRLILAPVAAAVLSACGGDTVPEAEKFLSNVDDCSGMPSRQAVTQCEASYYKALTKAEKELPRFTSKAECEKLYGTCEAPPAQQGQQAQNNSSGSNSGSFLVPAMAGYIAAQMVNDLGDGFRDRSNYYRDMERRKRDREYDQLYGAGSSQAGYSNSSANNGSTAKNSNHQPRPKVAPPPAKPKQPAKTESRGGWGSSAANKNSWGGGSKGSGWGG